MKAFTVLALIACACYFGFSRFVEQPAPPVLELPMSPEASAGLAQITPSKVVLFSTAWCGYCAKVKALLNKQGVRFTELDIERDPSNAKFQEDFMQVQGFPVLVVGSRIVAGYNEGAILAALKEL